MSFLLSSLPNRIDPHSILITGSLIELSALGIDSLVLNSLRTSHVYMRHKHTPSLDQIKACRLVGAKPLSEPMLEKC